MPGRPHQASAEHARIIQLIADGDAAGAAQLMKAHISGALDELVLDVD